MFNYEPPRFKLVRGPAAGCIRKEEKQACASAWSDCESRSENLGGRRGIFHDYASHPGKT